MPDNEPDQELTHEEIARALGRKPRWFAPVLISAGAIAILVVTYLFGPSLFPKGPEPTVSLKPLERLDEVKPAVEEAEQVSDKLGSTFLDSLDLMGISGDTLQDYGLDTLQNFIKKMLSTPVDTTQMVDIPSAPLDKIPGLLDGSLTENDLAAAAVSGESIDEQLATPIRPEDRLGFQGFFLEQQAPSIPEVQAPDTTSRQDTTHYPPPSSAEDLKKLADQKATIDSLLQLLSGKDQAIQSATGQISSLSTQLIKAKPAVDSAKAAQVQKFGKIVGTMQPMAAAKMLSTRTADEVVEILLQVKPKNAAAIMDALPPDLASQVAGRVVTK